MSPSSSGNLAMLSMEDTSLDTCFTTSAGETPASDKTTDSPVSLMLNDSNPLSVIWKTLLIMEAA